MCGPKSSPEANKICIDNWNLPRNICKRPCMDMKLRLAFLSKSKGESRVKFYLYTDIETMREVIPKTLLMLVAEIGGYLGLMLGVSVLDLKLCLPASFEIVKGKLFNFYNQLKQK